MNKKYIISAIVSLFAIVCGIVIINANTYKKYTTTYYDLFDTVCTFSAYTKTENEFDYYSNIAYAQLKRLNNLFDKYNTYENINNIKTINDSAGLSAVKVDADIVNLLNISKEMYYKTDKVFNISMGEVLNIWHTAREEEVLPNIQLLKAADKYSNIENIIIDTENSTVYLSDSYMSIDVGGVAKGYAVQAALDLLKENGLDNCIIDAGGNVAAIATPKDGRSAWEVGIQNPDTSSDKPYMDIVKIAGTCVITSGDYQRYFTIDGKRYNHIIDPFTLMPAEYYTSVTVIYNNSAYADILSTAAFILPYDKSRKLIEKYGAAAIWQTVDGSIYTTDNYSAYK